MAAIRKVLVANRGEIAVRIMRTCRRMGIATVAVFSDADADMPFVDAADQAVRIGPAPSADSYLSVEKILAAAKRTGADAIHPGYGFLAENAEFAQACEDAGVRFIGPSPAAIRSMGSKIEAKALVAAAGVPVIPGYDGANQATDVLAAEALKIGFPLLLKASAGGGGKGMRIVRQEGALEASIEAARREAKKAFGDDRLLVERYIDDPRHVEIQILGDSHGTLLHLFERECSIQRRHQKIIEETPSTAIDAGKRDEMGAAAVAAGSAIGYENAGTVEFILAPDGQFYFLEVNTRLQVEHPVTECVTGLDLVREQIRVAQGEPLGYGQADLTMNGAAVECRLYAEDPDNDFLPASGTVVGWHVPDMDGLRVDTGIRRGSVVSVHYDPMLAKVITHAPTRGEATRLMVRALEQMSVQGLKTNREFLLRVLAHPAYLAGEIDTHFIDRHLSGAPPARDPEVSRVACIAATLAGFEARRRARKILPALPRVYRTNPLDDEHVAFHVGDETVDVRYYNIAPSRFRISIGDFAGQVLLVASGPEEILFEDPDGLRHRVRVVVDGARIFTLSPLGAVSLEELPRFPIAGAEDEARGCEAPMTGTVIQVNAAAGDAVEAGQTLVIMEAMKMEHTLTAPRDGVVAEVRVEVGQLVDEGQLLVRLED